MKTKKSTRIPKPPASPKTTKLDLYKECREEYVMPRKPVVLDIGPAVYLAIRGKGSPGGEQFVKCIGALYAMAFTIKMTRKFAGKQDYTVCKLECRYGMDGVGDVFCEDDRENWEWELMIRTPSFVTTTDLRAAVKVLNTRKRGEGADQVVLRKLREGKCVQMLHVGPYQEEGRTIEVMRQFAASQRLKFSGCYHEIYISDPRRVAPEKLKTLLRHAVVRS